MKTIKFFLAAIVACSLAACSNHCCCCCGGEVEEVKLYGEFSVSENHKVRFSPGNLIRNANGSWSFAEEQFLYLGNMNDNDWSYSHDLFGFGQSGYKPAEFISPAKTEYTFYGGYNNLDGKCYDIDGTNWDWGIYHGITNGGNVPGLWRTLSMDEWDYLLNERPNAENKHCRAMVAGRRGLIILADNYKHPGGVEAIDPEQTYTVNKNVYCYTDWKKMEAGGAIFLPCAGIQDNIAAGSDKLRVYYPEMTGYYWTTTCAASDNNTAYSLHFGYESLKKLDLDVSLVFVNKRARCAVRLVQEIR